MYVAVGSQRYQAGTGRVASARRLNGCMAFAADDVGTCVARSSRVKDAGRPRVVAAQSAYQMGGRMEHIG